MGCCENKYQQFNDKVVLLAHCSNNNSTSSSNNQTTSHVENEKSQEFARGFFKQSTQKVVSSVNDLPKIFNPKMSDEYEDKLNDAFNEEEISRKSEEQIKFPTLKLEILKTEITREGSENIIITPNSINGKKKKLGEKFYFGSTKNSCGIFDLGPSDKKQNSMYWNSNNDYNFEDSSMASSQFEISYNPEKSKYYILENKTGTGTFLKIRNQLVVNRDMIISFCSCHMILQIFNDEKSPSNKIIKIKFLIGGRTTQEKIFSSNQKTKIRIGRSKKADVVCNDDSISRTQCTLIYENNQWCLNDGYLDNGHRGSTNGLWLLASCKLELKNDAIIKSGNTTINVKIVEH